MSDGSGRSVAGLIYRPIASAPTWALGIPAESYSRSNLNHPDHGIKPNENSPVNGNGFLVSSSGTSPFLDALIDRTRMNRVAVGGAGNKFLCLLEGKGDCYIQDRGVSRYVSVLYVRAAV